MGTKTFRQPAKLLDREFRALGAIRVHRNAQHISYRFPDGARIEVPFNIGPGRARDELFRIRDRYGRAAQTGAGDPLRNTMERDDVPTIDPAHTVMTKHATERFELMREQANLAELEILHAIQFPETVRWSPRHGSWLWVRGRVAVATNQNPIDGVTSIRTILWATQDLWEMNPRPEQEC